MLFELEKSNIRKEDIDEGTVTRFIVSIGIDKMDDANHPITVDENLTNLGVLAFTDNPESIIPGAYSTISEHSDSSSTSVIKTLKINGNLLSQYHKILEYLTSLTVERNNGCVPYDYSMLNSVIVNSLTTRDYQSQSPLVVTVTPTNISFCLPINGSIIVDTDLNPSLIKLFSDVGLYTTKDIIKNEKVLVNLDGGMLTLSVQANEGYISESVVKSASWMWASSKKRQAINYLRYIFNQYPYLYAITNQLIEYLFILGNEKTAVKILYDYSQFTSADKSVQPYITVARLYVLQGKYQLAKKCLQYLPPFKDLNELLTIIILKNKVFDFQSSHHILKQFYLTYKDEPQFLHEFAKVKLRIATKSGLDVQIKLYEEAEQFLIDAIALSNNDAQMAWYWFDLAKVNILLDKSEEDIDSAFNAAMMKLPKESLFKRDRDSWKSSITENR